jgi:hypothetical protein
MKLIKNRLRFCEAFKAMFEQPRKIGIRLSSWCSDGVLRLKREINESDQIVQIMYHTNDVSCSVILYGDELLSEEWETYEV